MTIDTKELRRLAQAVSGWSNCNQAWLDQSEDVPAAAVGHIDEDGNTYPVATIDCDQYYAAHQSLPLAKFYAAANPATINELLDRLEAAESEALEQARLNGMGSEREAALMAKLEAAEKDAAHQKALADSALRVAEGWERKCDELRAKIVEMEKQEPIGGMLEVSPHNYELRWYRPVPFGAKLYTLPGAQPQLNEIKITLKRALELSQRETWTGVRKHRSWEDQREEQKCWNKVWSLLGATGESE